MGYFKSILASIKNIASGSTITINGNYVGGRSIQVDNDTVIIDGKDIKINDRKIEIKITGNVESVDTAAGNVSVTGDAKRVSSVSGNVKVGGMTNGGVETTSGNIEIGGDVGGSINTTSGDVEVNGLVKGSVNTLSGDISYRK